jgi:ABC-2 type transport system permease protein
MLLPLILKDLKLFAADRRDVIVTIVVPIALAAFMAYIFGSRADGPDGASDVALPVAIVDRDDTPLTRAIIEDMRRSGVLKPEVMSPEGASGNVTTGRHSAAIFIPPGFSQRATASLFSAGKPEIRILYDPSKSIELQVVRGGLLQSGIQTIARESFSAENWRTTAQANLDRIESTGRLTVSQRLALRALFASLDRFYADNAPTTAPTATQPSSPFSASGLTAPFNLIAEPVGGAGGKNSANIRNATVAHIFAGMTIQGILFYAVEAAMNLLRDRSRGIWKRFRAAPLSRITLLSARIASGTLICLLIAAAVMLFGVLVYGIRIHGSIPGFLLITFMTALMAATFGLLIATIGRTEQQSRGFAILGVLIIVMLSGAWFPSFMMPRIVQQFGVILPSRWAIDGLDAMTWRGHAFADALTPSLALLTFSAVFAAIALARFRWEPK